MPKRMNKCIQTVTDEDVLEAMKRIPGYLDITPSDFLEVYRVAFDHALSRIRTAVPAEHIMTRKVIFIHEDTPLIEAVIKMAEREISGLPVLNNQNKVVGVISEKDFLVRMNEKHAPSIMQVLLQCMNTSSCLAVPFKRLKARDIMSSPPVTVNKNTPLIDVADKLDRFNINRIPVIDDHEKLVGIIARSDLLQAMC